MNLYLIIMALAANLCPYCHCSEVDITLCWCKIATAVPGVPKLNQRSILCFPFYFIGKQDLMLYCTNQALQVCKALQKRN